MGSNLELKSSGLEPRATSIIRFWMNRAKDDGRMDNSVDPAPASNKLRLLRKIIDQREIILCRSRRYSSHYSSIAYYLRSKSSTCSTLLSTTSAKPVTIVVWANVAIGDAVEAQLVPANICRRPYLTRLELWKPGWV